MSELLAALEQLSPRRILVLGDVILDRYTWGAADRVSPEAPTIVLRVDELEVRLGGAAAVAVLLRGLEADVVLAGVVGDDLAGRTVRKLLEECGVDSKLLVTDASRPTTTKERFMGRAPHRTPQQILRVDHEVTHDLASEVATELEAELTKRSSEFAAVLIADYAKGFCVPELLQSVITASRGQGLPVVVDPARRRDYSRYRGASIVKPNRAEAELASGTAIRVPMDAFPVGDTLRRECGCDAVVVTLDREGMAVIEATEPPRVFPSQVREVTDITGAGDTVLAMLGLALACRLPLATATRLAVVASGLQVERLGVAAITLDELRACLASRGAGDSKLVSLEQMTDLAAGYRARGRRVVFTNGCFDLLHVGHVASLQEAAMLGDVLVVAINGDAGIRRLKGPTRPVVGERSRAALLAALACVDHVLIFDDDTPRSLLAAIRPDVLAKGGTTTEIVGREFVESYGGTVVRTSPRPGVSTTALVSAIRSSGAPENNVTTPTSGRGPEPEVCDAGSISAKVQRQDAH